MRILIIEDEWIIAYDLNLILKSLGCDVVGTADNGNDAVRITQQLKPDVIFMDIKLKGLISGIDAAEIIMQRYGIPVIYVTAYYDADTMQRALSTNPVAYINKPFTEVELENVLNTAVNRKTS
jgi:two-component system, response regulator PdtaR